MSDAPVDVSDRRLRDGRTVVQVVGDLDVYSADVLRESLVRLVAAGRYDLVVDLRQVAFLDSTGLGVLVSGYKAVRAHGGSLHLVCTARRLLRVFALTGLDTVFPVHDDVPDDD